jgi:hypothetical protein
VYQTNNGSRAPLAATARPTEPRFANRFRPDAALGSEAASPVPYVTAGSLLVPGEVYIDLSQPCRGPFRALHGQMAGSRNRYVPQRALPVRLWHQIVEQCARMGVLPASRPGI